MPLPTPPAYLGLLLGEDEVSSLISLAGAKAKQVMPYSIPASTALCVTGAGSNTAVTAVLAADTQAGTVRPHNISCVQWSYSTAGAGRLTILDGHGVIHDSDITAAGPGERRFVPPLALSPGSSAQVILGAVANSTGKINVIAWRLD